MEVETNTVQSTVHSTVQSTIQSTTHTEHQTTDHTQQNPMNLLLMYDSLFFNEDLDEILISDSDLFCSVFKTVNDFFGDEGVDITNYLKYRSQLIKMLEEPSRLPSEKVFQALYFAIRVYDIYIENCSWEDLGVIGALAKEFSFKGVVLTQQLVAWLLRVTFGVKNGLVSDTSSDPFYEDEMRLTPVEKSVVILSFVTRCYNDSHILPEQQLLNKYSCLKNDIGLVKDVTVRILHLCNEIERVERLNKLPSIFVLRTKDVDFISNESILSTTKRTLNIKSVPLIEIVDPGDFMLRSKQWPKYESFLMPNTKHDMIVVPTLLVVTNGSRNAITTVEPMVTYFKNTYPVHRVVRV
ncbi:hypothetical protein YASMINEVIRUS_1220 [Yasminevirus sp. GU-2018]|uniref:Uncharacterized protein n=1 Tax=Yasminevirus sp. GU-2018 TaxID=2420051 RepID=A0A5K0U963_9VIRU|nr:hypothetical protein YASMINEVIRUS_1220 [Yasminevirus sp. GU-2018]